MVIDFVTVKGPKKMVISSIFRVSLDTRGGYTSNIDNFFSNPAPMPICTNNAIMSEV